MSVKPAVLRRLMREITELQNSPPEGIRVVASEHNMLDLTGIIQGPEGTPYSGGYFKVKFSFTEEFPAAPPKCRMVTKIFHPNVSTAGEICVNTLKKDWQASYGIAHILVTIKCLLIYPNPESALDEEAGKLLLENYDNYCDRAKLITSVHARARPAEFAPASTSTSAPSSSSSTPTTANTASSLTSLPTSSAPFIAVSKPTSRKASATASQPLQSTVVLSNTIPTIPTSSSLIVEKSKDKDRHPSPSPLGTADGNVASSAASNSPPAPAPATKAVKRSAGAAANGTEKRKKALKRL